MKISIVTAVFNRVHCVANAINSLRSQQYSNIEHVVIDGASTDGTLDVVRDMLSPQTMLISEPDAGIYDALNKGFALSTGDVVGILHSDDEYYDKNVLDRVANAFQDDSIDYVYGDIVMVSDTGDVKRYWKSGPLCNGRITSSQIPHPGLFLSRKLLSQIEPYFDKSYRISADLKQQLIFANLLQAKGAYISGPLVKMKVGGTSTVNVRAYLNGWFESRRAWNEVHGRGGSLYVVKKVLSKLKGIRF